MKKPNLTHEEQDILKAFEEGEFKSIISAERKINLQIAAEATLKKNKRIQISISERDLEALQMRAMEEGLPYQTLVSSVLHKYASGGLIDLMASKPRSINP
jgi:hypothetical protein